MSFTIGETVYHNMWERNVTIVGKGIVDGMFVVEAEKGPTIVREDRLTKIAKTSRRKTKEQVARVILEHPKTKALAEHIYVSTSGPNYGLAAISWNSTNREDVDWALNYYNVPEVELLQAGLIHEDTLAGTRVIKGKLRGAGQRAKATVDFNAPINDEDIVELREFGISVNNRDDSSHSSIDTFHFWFYYYKFLLAKGLKPVKKGYEWTSALPN